MKKFFKIIGIIFAAFFGVAIVAGVIGAMLDSNEEPKEKEKTEISKLEVIKKSLETVDDSTTFNAYFGDIEQIANGNSSDAAEAKDFLKYRADYKFSMQQRALKKWVEYAKLEFPKHFSDWDGSNKFLVEKVKANMKDPDSFKHVETRWEYGSGYKYIRVQMQYRGKNSFNATMTETITVKMDIQGNILEVE